MVLGREEDFNHNDTTYVTTGDLGKAIVGVSAF
jgi:hypothetical protein